MPSASCQARGLEGKIDCGERSGEHDRGAAPGISEDEELGWRHDEADFRGFAAVVDAGEDGDALCAEDGFESVEGFGNSVGAEMGDEAVGGGHLGLPGRSVSGM